MWATGILSLAEFGFHDPHAPREDSAALFCNRIEHGGLYPNRPPAGGHFEAGRDYVHFASFVEFGFSPAAASVLARRKATGNRIHSKLFASEIIEHQHFIDLR